MVGTIFYRRSTRAEQMGMVLLPSWQVSSAIVRLSSQDGWSLDLETAEEIPVGDRITVRLGSEWFEFVCTGYEKVWGGGIPLYRYTMPWSVWHDLAGTVVEAAPSDYPSTGSTQAAIDTLLARTTWRTRTALRYAGHLDYGNVSAWEALESILAMTDFEASAEALGQNISAVVIEPSLSYGAGGMVSGSRWLTLRAVDPEAPPVLCIDPAIMGATVTERVEDDLKPARIYPLLDGEPIIPTTPGATPVYYTSDYAAARGGSYAAGSGTDPSALQYVERWYDVEGAQSVTEATVFMSNNIRLLTEWQAEVASSAAFKFADLGTLPKPGQNALVARTYRQRSVQGIYYGETSDVLPITETTADLLTGAVEVSAGGLVRNIPLIQQRKEL